MKKILSIIIMCVAVFSMTSCNDQIKVQQHYDYALEVMPYANEITNGETVEIRCELITTGNYDDAVFTIRYFQTDGDGELRMDNKAPFKPNDRYLIEDDVFRLFYTSQCDDAQEVEIYIEDNFGQVEKLVFEFTNESVETETETEPNTNEVTE